jgi:hypothetical protein
MGHKVEPQVGEPLLDLGKRLVLGQGHGLMLPGHRR